MSIISLTAIAAMSAAVAIPPLTPKERADAAASAAESFIESLNEHLGSSRFKPRVLNVFDMRTKGSPDVIVELRGGDRAGTMIACKCRVYDETMKVYQFSVWKQAVPKPGHSSRTQGVEAMEKILSAFVKKYSNDDREVMDEWDRVKVAVEKIGLPWEKTSGDNKFQGMADKRRIGFFVTMDPKLVPKNPYR